MEGEFPTCCLSRSDYVFSSYMSKYASLTHQFEFIMSHETVFVISYYQTLNISVM